MGKRSRNWVVQVTPKLKRDMEDTAHAAYVNGSNILQDADVLFKAGRYPRALALAILAEEEYSKAFILKNCSIQGRWDAAIYNGLREHSPKQGISEVLREYVQWLVDDHTRVMKRNQFSLVPMQPSMYPGDKHLNEILDKGKSRLKKPIKDYLKQDALYVDINESAKIKSIPGKIGAEEAKKCLDESFVFKVITEIQFGDYTNSESLEKFLRDESGH